MPPQSIVRGRIPPNPPGAKGVGCGWSVPVAFPGEGAEAMLAGPQDLFAMAGKKMAIEYSFL
jgi:hypothetical protein